MSDISLTPMSADPSTKTISQIGVRSDCILSEVRDRRRLIQEYQPLCRSIEWELGQQYWTSEGNRAFVRDEVPYAINNSGYFSISAAEILFSALHMEEGGPEADIESEILVLELGIGVGLFARFFLDHFQRLCQSSQRNYYDRISYIAADSSPRMLEDAARSGIFTRHAGHYRLRLLDAMNCEDNLKLEIEQSYGANPRIRAIFLNYILDCLPPTVMMTTENDVKPLMVRTYVSRNSGMGC